jgi:hypothetical protein
MIDSKQKRRRTPLLVRVYRSRPASVRFLRNWLNGQVRTVHFPSPLGRGGRGEGFGDLLHRRKEIFEDAPCAEVNLGAGLQSGREVGATALAFNLRPVEID